MPCSQAFVDWRGPRDECQQSDGGACGCVDAELQEAFWLHVLAVAVWAIPRAFAVCRRGARARL